MKINIRLFPALLMSVLLMAGCQKNLESEIAELKDRVRALELSIADMNDQCKALSDIVAAIERNDLIEKVEKMENDTYRLTFSSGNKVVLRNGVDGVMPIMGVQKDPDTDFYYWTVQMGPQGSVKWLYDEKNRRVRASAIVPRVKVETTGDKDYWYYSFDESSWYLLDGSGTTTAHGIPGSPLFESVDCSSDSFVAITLASGYTFRIPTQAEFGKLNAMCDTLNGNIAVIAELLEKIDTNVFVKSVNVLENSGTVEGYEIELADGKILTLCNGKNYEGDARELSIGWNSDLGARCWNLDGEPVEYNGEIVRADPWMEVPVLGAVAMEGTFYFTIKVGDGEAQLLLDAEGNPVPASPFRLFESVSENQGVIELTLFSDIKINLIKMSDCTPSLHLKSEEWTVAKASAGSFIASIDSLGINAVEEFKYELEAVSMDSTCVIVSVEDGEFVTGTPKKSIKHTVKFQLKESAAVGDTVRIAVFLAWDTHTIMKVAEVAVTEEQEAE